MRTCLIIVGSRSYRLSNCPISLVLMGYWRVVTMMRLALSLEANPQQKSWSQRDLRAPSSPRKWQCQLLLSHPSCKYLFTNVFSAITQPKLTDLDRPFWLAPRPLYVSQLRARLNFGSALLRTAPPRLRQLPDELSLTPRFLFSARPYSLSPSAQLIWTQKTPLEVLGNFARTASPDERMRVMLGIQRWPRIGIPGRTAN
jgi:hypothetical protein